MLVSKEIPALWNGVSQQPATVRSLTQAELQVNCYGTVVDGLGKRPPATHVALITEDDLSAAYIHTINRDVTRRFIAVLTDGDLKVYGLDGEEKTVTFPLGKGYLDVADAQLDFSCVTVADYTFVLNKGVAVDLLDEGADEFDQDEEQFWLSRGAYGAQLVAGTILGHAVQLQYPPNPSGGSYLGEKQAFEELPESPANGDIYKISGTAESGFTAYYVRRNGAVWEETVKPGLKNRIDPETMPWALVHMPDDSFVFAPFSWADRRVGDETTNPNPVFVGRAIRDIFFYKNRLGFAVEEGAVASRIGDFGNFYRLTVLQLLADEVTDLQASETKVTQVAHAVSFDTGMMLFSDQVQFRVTEGDTFGPGTAGLKPATAYTMKTEVKPLPLGSDVYFAVENGPWAQIREYFVRDNAVGNEAADITGHVPKYLPAGVKQLSGSPTHDVLFVNTSGAPSRLYVYKFFWTDDNTKAQSAWNYWQFDSDVTVLSHAVLDNDLYVLVQREDGAYLERVPLASGAIAPGLTHQLFLDRRVAVTGTYLEGEDKTEFTLPYPVAEDVRDTFRIVRGPDFEGATGAILSVAAEDYVWDDEVTVSVTGDFSAGECFVGHTYEQRHRFSKQFLKGTDGAAVLNGKLTMRTMTVYFVDTAYFRSEVASYGTDVDGIDYIPSTESNFDGKTIGQAALVLGSPVFASGQQTFGVYGDSTVALVDIVNDSPYQALFTQASYEGFWSKRAKAI